MRKLTIYILFILCFGLQYANASQLLIPMDDMQRNHLKAYGISYWIINNGQEVTWLLNYRGGAFLTNQSPSIETELNTRGVSYEKISDNKANQILLEIASPDANMDAVKLEKAPKVAVYSPKNKLPWDDAVTMVLTYAEIPYTIIFDDEVMGDELAKFDWLHLHHEDFTGQYGKFYASYSNADWYKAQQRSYEESARKHGFNKVSKLKLATVLKIKEFVAGGGFLFAMCSATDTYDIALAASGTDICESMFDGDPADPNCQQKLDFNQTFAFQNFVLSRSPYEYEYSNIDNNKGERGLGEDNDFFNLFQFSAKWDPIPTMLTQNHTSLVHGYMGQTTGFKKRLIKPEVTILGENTSIGEAKYIHGTIQKGFFTFYGGHDPEDYEHYVGEEPTDLNLHPNSPGFRLILNNILFPAAKKKKQKT